ncbi:MAG: hypothetical protein WEB06_10735 [Actinomycetota bacterium]
MERTQKLRIFGIGAGVVATALWAFGVPLATILLVGVWLLCPLMMMGMHGGHGHGSHEAHRPGDTLEKHEASTHTGGNGRHG